MPLLLDNPIRGYAWGSPTVLPELLGVPPTGEPQAELWMGAHPAAPSSVQSGQERLTLADLIDRDPELMLGSDVVALYGPRLPYLLKVLAIDRPLSIQAHPTIEQAEAGYAAEDAAGIALDAPHRSYRDRSHKPEMIVALTEVEALVGFRDPAEAAAVIDALGVPALSGAAATLRAGGAAALAAVVRGWLRLTPDAAAALVGAVVDTPSRSASGSASGSASPTAELVGRLADEYPGDRGILLALLLRHERLEPGEAVFLPAGVPHAYLRGVAVEPQASSDNTLRAGLTGKHIDVDELMRILRYEPRPDPRVEPRVDGAVWTYAPAVDEFRLTRAEVHGTPVVLTDPGPRIVLTLDGGLVVRTSEGRVETRRGQALFVPAGEGTLELAGRGTAFMVAPNLAPSSPC